MIPALLETIGALSLLVSVAAKIALLRRACDEDVPTRDAGSHVDRTCASRVLPVQGAARSATPTPYAQCALRSSGGRPSGFFAAS